MEGEANEVEDDDEEEEEEEDDDDEEDDSPLENKLKSLPKMLNSLEDADEDEDEDYDDDDDDDEDDDDEPLWSRCSRRRTWSSAAPRSWRA